MLSLHIYNSPLEDETKFKNLLYDKPIDELHNQVVKLEKSLREGLFYIIWAYCYFYSYTNRKVTKHT